MLVRTWNLFHGNTVPPGRQAYLEEMVRLASADRPGIVCLQEIPVWALPHLTAWSGMSAFGDVAARPRLGPLPSTASVGRKLTELNNGLFRSALTGQANAILLDPAAWALERRSIVLNARRFRRAQARWLGLDLVARLAWAKERRICQAVRAELADGRTALVANLHATSYGPDDRLADAELLRAATLADALARPEDICILAGDFNITAAHSRTLAELSGAEWGFTRADAGIDHVLVRGAHASEARRWPDERRRHDGRLLSDHAPVEVELE